MREGARLMSANARHLDETFTVLKAQRRASGKGFDATVSATLLSLGEKMEDREYRLCADTGPMTALETECQACQWCASPMAVRRRRGSERRFCGPECRLQHHAAVRQLGNHVASDRFGGPGELSGWLGKACTPREDRRETKSAHEVSDTPTKAPARPRPSYGFCQFGHNWFVTGRDGQHVAGPLRTAVEAKDLARRMTEDVRKNNPDVGQLVQEAARAS